MKQELDIRKKIEYNWHLAAERIGFKLISPFICNFNYNDYSILAYLPEYGSERGMIIELIYPPEFTIDDNIVNLAIQKGYYYSFINVDMYINYEEDAFVEALDDWGKYVSSDMHSM